jgi:outer membrane protein assembly factor BamA
VPASMLLLGEISHLAHNAALGVAAMCGNNCIAPAAAPGIVASRDIQPAGFSVQPDPDMFLSATPGAGSSASGMSENMPFHGNYVTFADDASGSATTAGPMTSGLAAGSVIPGELEIGLDAEGELQDPAEDGKTALERALAPRGGLTLSGGYSSIEGISVGGKIARTNIFGSSNELSMSARYSNVRTLFELGYADANFLGSSLAFGPTLFANRQSAKGFGNGFGLTPFSQSARGINIGLARRFEDGLSATANYRLSDDSFRMNGKGITCDSAVFGSPICGAIGSSTSSIMSFALAFDRKTRDGSEVRGFKLRLTQDMGVGGSASFVRTRLGGEAHIGLGGNWSLSFDTEGGFMAPIGKDKIPLFDRFFIGDSSMRGFDLRGIGPKVRPSAAQAGQNVAIGGSAYYVARAELSVGVGGLLGAYGVRPGIFVDAGSVFSASKGSLLPGETLIGNSARPRLSVGIGLALNTPAGKLRIDFAKPVLKQEGDRAKMLSISFGAAM